MTEEGYLRLATDLGQSIENAKLFASRLDELGLGQEDLEGVVSVLRGQLGEHQEKIAFTERAIDDWSRRLNLTHAETMKLTASLETMGLRIDGMGANPLLEDLCARLSATERAIDQMLSEVGVHGDDISSMKTMLLQEDGVTRGELRELVPFINTLKTIVANQMSLEESQRIEDPYKASLFQSLRRELNATYLASTSVQSEILKSNLSGKMGKLGKILTAVGGSVPMIGGGVQFLGMVLSQVDSLEQSEYVKRYSRVARSVTEMDEIARSIAMQLLDDGFDKSVLDQPQSLLK
jgi:hypothetical protein